MVTTKIDIYFASHLGEILPPPGALAVVFEFPDVPSERQRRRISSNYALYDATQGLLTKDSVLLSFTPRDSKRTAPPGPHVVDNSKKLQPAEKLPPFFTMHRNMQAYRNVVQALGSKMARRFLTAINDLVAIKAVRSKQRFLNDVTQTSAFLEHFMRSNEMRFAFYNAESVLRGLDEEVLGGISDRLLLTFRLDTFPNDHVIPIAFNSNSDIPSRISVMIGKNGTGKSRAMFNFVESILLNDKRLRKEDGEPPVMNRVLAVCSPGETWSSFPTPRSTNRIMYRRIMLGSHATTGADAGFGATLLQLALSPESIRGMSRRSLFLKAVNRIIDPAQIFVRWVKPPHQRSVRRVMSGVQSREELVEPVPLSEMLSGDDENLLGRFRGLDMRADICRYVAGKTIPLSSGQWTFIRFAAQVCLYIENGTMVLIEEPETHLHPNLISDFVHLLDDLLAQTGSFAILATHSAYFVREAPRSQVIILNVNESGRIEVVPPRLKTLGADVGAISAFVFEEKPIGTLVSELGSRLAGDEKTAATRLDRIEDELPAEAVMHLRRIIAQ